jgi:hypothetical protein
VRTSPAFGTSPTMVYHSDKRRLDVTCRNYYFFLLCCLPMEDWVRHLSRCIYFVCYGRARSMHESRHLLASTENQLTVFISHPLTFRLTRFPLCPFSASSSKPKVYFLSTESNLSFPFHLLLQTIPLIPTLVLSLSSLCARY